MPTKNRTDIINPNPLKDTNNAYIKLKKKGFFKNTDPNMILGNDDVNWQKSPNFKARITVYTPLDEIFHTYWKSISIDTQVQEFMGTCELHAPYDSDLMAYWQPIAQTCIVYGSNKGPMKVLFIGRVREVKQDGYECVITLQNYGWKFQQNAPAKFVEDNVINKDAYTILRNIFEVLKIRGYTISENAKQRLKSVGINSDGNLTLNNKEIKEMPDLLKRLQSLKQSDMTKIMGKNVITEKEMEERINWEDIFNLNYTLRYTEPTATMSKLNDSSRYTPGNAIYHNNYNKETNQHYTSDKTKTGSHIWSAISEVVNRAVTVSSGTINGEKIIDQYIRRLYKADATWLNIAKIIDGHAIKPKAKKEGWTKDLIIRTIYYIKRDGISFQDAYNKAKKEEESKSLNPFDIPSRILEWTDEIINIWDRTIFHD